MEVFATVRFLTAALTAFLATVVVLGGGGYLASQLMVPPMRDVFRTAAFEFDLAPGWWCELDGSEYVCSPPGKPPYAAIAILAMKERNDQDNLKAYEGQLKQPRPIDNGAGGERKFSRQIQGNDQNVARLPAIVAGQFPASPSRLVSLPLLVR